MSKVVEYGFNVLKNNGPKAVHEVYKDTYDLDIRLREDYNWMDDGVDIVATCAGFSPCCSKAEPLGDYTERMCKGQEIPLQLNGDGAMRYCPHCGAQYRFNILNPELIAL